MEVSYRDIRCKDVVCLNDGRKLGKIVDIIFDYPEGKICAIVVPGEKSGLFKPCGEIVIEFCQIEKIGEDVVLIREKRPLPPPPKPPCPHGRYDRCARDECEE